MASLAAILAFDPSVSPVAGWTLAILAVLIIGIAKSGFGGGVGILAVPLFALAFGAREGNAILLPLLIAADVFSVYNHFGNWDKPTLRKLLPGTMLGILMGSVLLYLLVFGATFPPNLAMVDPTSKTAARVFSENALNLLTGIVSILYVALDVIRQKFAPHWHLKPDSKTGFAAGSAVGVISTLAHAAGPVAAIFLLNTNLPRAAFIATTVIYFFIINIAKLPTYISLQLITLATVKASLLFLPVVPVGTYLGKTISHRLSEKTFRNIIMVIVLITGLQLTLETLFPQYKLAALLSRLFQ